MNSSSQVAPEEEDLQCGVLWVSRFNLDGLRLRLDGLHGGGEGREPFGAVPGAECIAREGRGRASTTCTTRTVTTRWQLMWSSCRHFYGGVGGTVLRNGTF